MDKIDGEELQNRLPDFKKELEYLNSKSFTDYEKKLDTATGNSIDALNDIIEDNTLKMDPEQLVNAVKVLTSAKKDIMEGKRRLLETVIRGEAMMKALEQNTKKDSGGSSMLEDYIQNQKMIDNGNNSIFQQVEKLQGE